MQTTETSLSLNRTARRAGFMFLILPMGGILYGAFIMFKLGNPGDAALAGSNILANTALFRIGIVYEMVMAVIAVALGSCLYTLLRRVDDNLARVALYFKLAEGVLVAVLALASFVVLQMLTARGTAVIHGNVQWRAVLGEFLNHRMLHYAVPMLLLGLGFTLFFLLLRRSGYVPRWLGCFGVIAYALIFLLSLVSILDPGSLNRTAQTLIAGPSIIFELTAGCWLLFKGIDTSRLP